MGWTLLTKVAGWDTKAWCLGPSDRPASSRRSFLLSSLGLLGPSMTDENAPPSPAAYELKSISHSGYLTKQGGHIKSWKSRWCAIADGYMFYYVNDTAKDPKGIISLINCDAQ